MKFIKKPVVIDAIQFTKEMAEGKAELPDGVVFCSRILNSNQEFYPTHKYNNFQYCHKHIIETLEGVMRVQVGDWVITGVNGERYPCKPDIFEKTYEVFESPKQEGRSHE